VVDGVVGEIPSQLFRVGDDHSLQNSVTSSSAERVMTSWNTLISTKSRPNVIEIPYRLARASSLGECFSQIYCAGSDRRDDATVDQ
jgi:hypothetical protein